MKLKLHIILYFIFGLALAVRTIGITKVPYSLNWDEVSFGYSAYSLLLTGKDEFGVTVPLQFKSVGDYKNPLYIYLLVLPIKILGLNELAVRFPPALLGSLAVMAGAGIAYEMLRNRFWTIICGLLLVFSPWQIQFSRAGADVGISTFFVTWGIWLYLRNKKKLSALMLAGSMYTYFADKMFTPLIALVLSGLRNYKFLLLFGVLISGVVITGSSDGHRGKVWMTTLLSYRPSTETVEILQSQDNKVIYNIFHNNAWLYGKMFLDRYFNHFSPKFLFTQGPDDNRQRIIGMGMMLWPEFILALITIFYGDKFGIKHKKLLLIWLLLAPLPAAITKDAMHARRALNMVYPLAIWFAAAGMYVWQKNKPFVRNWIAGLFLLVWSLALLRYLVSYYVWTPIYTANNGGWQYGYKQLVKIIAPIAGKYDKVIVDTTYQGPYIFYLFYTKYPPAAYQKQANLEIENSLALGESRGFDNFEFREVFWPNDRGMKKTLIAAPPNRLPKKDIETKEARLIDEISFPGGDTAWRVVETY